MDEDIQASKGPSTSDNATRAGESVASRSTHERSGSDEVDDGGDGDDERELPPKTRKRRKRSKQPLRTLWRPELYWEQPITSPETPTTRQQVGGVAGRQSDTDSIWRPPQTRLLDSHKADSDVAFDTTRPAESEGEPQGSMDDVMRREDRNDGSFSPRNSPGSEKG